MRLFKRSAGDKGAAIERAYFDADRGCISLALERMADIREEFPRDAVLEYAEGCMRKESLGQGRRALEQFRLAQKYDPNHLFSAYNAAKYSDSEEDYRKRAAHARRLAPDDPDLEFFVEVDQTLASGQTWGDLLTDCSAAAQQHGKYGEGAALAELAIVAGEWSRTEELNLRHGRCASLRELDRAEEAARKVRHEDYPPCERLALDEALVELEHVLALDPSDPMMFNFKSAWLGLKRQYKEVVVAADAALALQPSGYLRPLTNKAWALFHLGQTREACALSNRVIEEASGLGSEFADDVAKARGCIEAISAAGTKPTDDQMLAAIAENCTRSAKLTADEARNLWQARSRSGFDLTRGIQTRCARYGQRWNDDYISQTADLFHDFCPEWAFCAVLDLSNINQAAYAHYLHAALFVAAQVDGVMERDACRFYALTVFGAVDPASIRRVYREAILAPAAVDERFAPLPGRMRRELERLHPDLPRLLADQPPVQEHERTRALTITLARFREGVSRDPTPAQRPGASTGIFSTLRSFFSRRGN